MTEEFDVMTLGSGPGGYVAAIRAAQLGLKSACIEAESLGGVCLNWGCIPNGVLLHHAEFISHIQSNVRDFGFHFEGFQADFAVAVERSRRIAKRLVGGIGHLFKKNGVTHIKGYGRLTDANTVEVEGTSYRARNIILATGATWNRPQDVGIEGEIDGERILAYRHAVIRQEIPRSVIVVGSGIIGVEFSFTYNTYGAEVTLLERYPQLLPLQDSEIAKELESAFHKQGIKTRTRTTVKKVESIGDRVRVTVAPVEGGEQETLEADCALLAIGVRPNSANIGLETVGVETDRRGNIVIDGETRTNVPHIFAVGDVTGKLNFASVASHMGLVAAEAIAGHSPKPLNYRMLPRVAYCNPQTAAFGYTEDELRKDGIPYNIGRFPFLANGKALGLGQEQGFIKILGHAESGEMLGAHMIGPQVGELVGEFTLARELGATLPELFRAVHPHPTISEAIAEAAMGVEGQTINF